MAPRASGDARKAVERAREQSESDERERATSAAAVRAAERRVETLHSRSGVRRFLFENGLSLTMFVLFLGSFAGQVLAGHRVYNEDQREHHEAPITMGAYLRTGAFLEATAENWESEFLQMGVFVLLTVFLYQRGSSESKTIEEPAGVDQDPAAGRNDPDAPWPVRRGGFWLAIYKNSLGATLLLLFVVSFTAHAIGGAAEYNRGQLQHGGSPVSAFAYIVTSQFWFESFQNWQSEFFSVGVLVLMSIWLRQQGSPQSKPVAAPATSTSE